jgi:hypothetical protein
VGPGRMLHIHGGLPFRFPPDPQYNEIQKSIRKSGIRTIHYIRKAYETQGKPMDSDAFRKRGKQAFFIAFHDVLPQFHRGFADISSVFQTYS